jgi:hypothetical protein
VDKKQELKKEGKNKRAFDKAQKKLTKRHLSLQDPATRKRMKKHKKDTKKTMKRNMLPNNKKKIK